MWGGKPLEGHSIPEVYGAMQPTAVFVPLDAMLESDANWELCNTELFGPFQVGPCFPSGCSLVGLTPQVRLTWCWLHPAVNLWVHQSGFGQLARKLEHALQPASCSALCTQAPSLLQQC